MIAARFNANGSLDDGGGSDSTAGDSFGTSGIATAGFYAGANDHANSIVLAPNGDIVLAGDATSGGTVLMAVAEFTTSGTLDTNFSSDGLLALAAGNANAVAVDGIGRITVAGYGPRAGHSDSDFLLKRFNADGSYDTGFGATGTIQTDFNSGYYDSAYAIALNDTSVIAVGGTGSTSATGDFAIAMYTPGGTAVQRVYAQHDANHNVTSLVSTAGTVVQRFTYLPYGQSQVLSNAWTSTNDAYDWAYRFQGGRLETGTGKVYFRNRDYDVTTGTWEEEDPRGYVRGADLYQSNSGNPVGRVDPRGTDDFIAESHRTPTDDGKGYIYIQKITRTHYAGLTSMFLGTDHHMEDVVFFKRYVICHPNKEVEAVLANNLRDQRQALQDEDDMVTLQHQMTAAAFAIALFVATPLACELAGAAFFGAEGAAAATTASNVAVDAAESASTDGTATVLQHSGTHFSVSVTDGEGVLQTHQVIMGDQSVTNILTATIG